MLKNFLIKVSAGAKENRVINEGGWLRVRTNAPKEKRREGLIARPTRLLINILIYQNQPFVLYEGRRHPKNSLK
jgi:hypothetical protein